MRKSGALFIGFIHLLISGILLSSPAQATDGLQWKNPPEGQHRWFIDNEVHLPQFMWFVSDQNKEVRVLAYQTTMVTTCGSGIMQSKRAFGMECVIDKIAIRASSLQADRNRLAPILEEMTSKLTSATVMLRLKSNGKLSTFSFKEADSNKAQNRRINQMHENLRLILLRSFSGMDLELPKKGTTQEEYWFQFDNALFMAPSTVGTRGTAEIIHRVASTNGQQVVIHSSGEGTLTPGDDGLNYYTTRLESSAIFDRESGVLIERGWTCAGHPTASSAFAQAGLGLPYIQRGALKRIGLKQTVDVGVSVEVLPNMEQPGLIGTWGSIGSPIGEPGN